MAFAATWASSHQTCRRENSRRLSRHFAGPAAGDKESVWARSWPTRGRRESYRGSGKPELTMD